MANTATAIAPTQSYTLFGNRIEVQCFGRSGNYDWALKGEPPTTLMRVHDLMVAAGVNTVYAPEPELFNARVAEAGDFTHPVELVNDRTLWRGVKANGGVVPRGGAYWLSSADCPTIIAHEANSGTTIAAHAGRDCLFDRQRITGRGPSRERESVVDAIVAALQQHQFASRQAIRVFVCGGISAEHFPHPVGDPDHGAANAALCLDALMKYGPTCLVGNSGLGMLSLTEVIRAQFLRHGVPAYRIGNDGVDTYGDVDFEGQPLWWSHRRGDGMRRNGVLVIRRW